MGCWGAGERVFSLKGLAEAGPLLVLVEATEGNTSQPHWRPPALSLSRTEWMDRWVLCAREGL